MVKLPPDLVPCLALASFLGLLAGAVMYVYQQWDAMDPTTYPTGPELRRAANIARLRASDDPLLPMLVEAASKASAEGRYSCCVKIDDALAPDKDRLARIMAALEALQIRGQWRERGAGCFIDLSF